MLLLFGSSTGTTALPAEDALALAGQAPSLLRTYRADPAQDPLVLTGSAPTVLVANVATPAQDPLVLTGSVPTVVVAHAATPDTDSLALTGYAPTLFVQHAATPDTDPLALTGYAPTPSVAAAPVVISVPNGVISQGDPYFSSVVLGLHMDGSNGSTTLTDIAGKTVTAFGAAALSTSVFKFGGASLSLNGTNAYATIPNSADFDFSGDFTIELQINPNAGFASSPTLLAKWDGLGSLAWILECNGSNISFSRGNGTGVFGATHNFAWTPPSNGSWAHLAISRASGVIRAFLDGNQQGSDTSDSTNLAANSQLAIGRNNDGATKYFNGYIDDVRITKGVARYTGAFTPPNTSFPNNDANTAPTIGVVAAVAISTAEGALTITGGSAPTVRINWAEFVAPTASLDSAVPTIGTPSTANIEAVTSTPPTTSLDSAVPTIGTPSTASVEAVTAAPPTTSLDAAVPTQQLLYGGGVVAFPQARGLGISSIGPFIGTIGVSTGAVAVTGHIPTLAFTTAGPVIEVGSGTVSVATAGTAPSPLVHVPVISVPNGVVTLGDPHSASVVLGLSFDGADGSTVFTEYSGKTVSVFGQAQIDTAQSKFGGASGLFDGSGDYLTVPDSADFDFPGDLTIEAWCRATDVSGARDIFSMPGALLALYKTSGNKFALYQSGDRITGTTTVVINTWYHVAIVRSAGVFRLYVDGVSEGGTWSNATSHNATAAPVIGSWQGASEYWQGWIDDLRITKGVARYTSDFTPPTSPVVGTTAPTVSVASGPVAISVSERGLTITGYAPSLGVTHVIPTSTGALAVGGQAPSLSFVTDFTFSVPSASVALTGQTPQAFRQFLISVASGQGTITGRTPTIGISPRIAVSSGSVAVAGYAPTVGVTLPTIIGVPQGALVVTSQTGDEYRSFTKFHLALDGADGQNSTAVFTDVLGTAPTSIGSTASIRTTVGGSRGAAAYLDGTSNAKVQYPDLAALNFGSSDYTIEFSLYQTASVTFPSRIFGDVVWGNDSQTSFVVDVVSGGGLQFLSVGTNYNYLSFSTSTHGSGVSSLNRWVRWAITRENGVHRAFCDGVQVLAKPISGTINNGTNGMVLQPDYNYKYTGYIDDVRVTVGKARYREDYTPIGLPTTVLVDTAPTLVKSFTEVVVGVPTGALYFDTGDQHVSSVSFRQAEVRDSDTVFRDDLGSTITMGSGVSLLRSGAAYGNGAWQFDGSADTTLTGSSSAFNFGSGQYTIDGWLYFEDRFVFGDTALFSKTSSYSITMASTGNPSLVSLNYQWGGLTLAADAPMRTWFHFAVTRSADGNHRIYVDGVLGTSGQIASVDRDNANDPVFVGGKRFKLQGFRVTKGVARYPTSNFSPPSRRPAGKLDLTPTSLVQGMLAPVPVGAAQITGYAPTLAGTIAVIATPAAGVLVATGQATSISAPLPPTFVYLSGQAVVAAVGRAVSPAAGAISVTGGAVTLLETGGPKVGTVTITGHMPLVSISPYVPKAAVALTGGQSGFGIGYGTPARSTSITTYAPTLSVAAPASIPTGAITVGSSAPSVSFGQAPMAATRANTITGYAPTATIGVQAFPAARSVVVTGQANAAVQRHNSAQISGSATIAGQSVTPIRNHIVLPSAGGVQASGVTPSRLRNHVMLPAEATVTLDTWSPFAARLYVLAVGAGSVGFGVGAVGIAVADKFAFAKGTVVLTFQDSTRIITNVPEYVVFNSPESISVVKIGSATYVLTSPEDAATVTKKSPLFVLT